MKLKSSVMTCLLALGLVATLRAQDIKLNIPGQTATPAPAPAPAAAPAAAAAAPAAPVYTETQLLEEYGWLIGKRIGLSSLNFSPEQIQMVLKGVFAASYGKPSPSELEKIGPVMDEFIKAKQSEYVTKLRHKDLADSAAFMTEIKKKAGVTVLPDGLCYEILKAGEGPAPKPSDTVTVHYTGVLIDGTVFDSSIQRGAPAEVALDQAIPGWTEGLQKSSKGGKIRLYIPPDLAYGDDFTPGSPIPPSSTLVFEIELIDIKPTPITAPAGDASAAPATTPATPAPTGK